MFTQNLEQAKINERHSVMVHFEAAPSPFGASPVREQCFHLHCRCWGELPHECTSETICVHCEEGWLYQF